MKKILFMSLYYIMDIDNHGIYEDLLRNLVLSGYDVTIVTASERRNNEVTRVFYRENYRILRVKCGNITKTNIIEKGISTLTIGMTFRRAMRNYLGSSVYDLIMYPTPPITIYTVVKAAKKQSKRARTYLMLKDIFPQNAVDLGFIRNNGLLHRYFRSIERKLYSLSDRIGCMSPANIEYILKHNKSISSKKIEIFPNALEVLPLNNNEEKRAQIREKLGIDSSAIMFLFGGNLSEGHNTLFTLRNFAELEHQGRNVFLVLAGAGTYVVKIEEFISNNKLERIKYIGALSRDEYSEITNACDVGLILLDRRFNIPNFPSRLLSYLQSGKPVLAVTDKNTDIGRIAEENGFGWSCDDGDEQGFNKIIDKIETSNLKQMGEYGYRYFVANYNVLSNIEIIKRFMEEHDE